MTDWLGDQCEKHKARITDSVLLNIEDMGVRYYIHIYLFIFYQLVSLGRQGTWRQFEDPKEFWGRSPLSLILSNVAPPEIPRCRIFTRINVQRKWFWFILVLSIKPPKMVLHGLWYAFCQRFREEFRQPVYLFIFSTRETVAVPLSLQLRSWKIEIMWWLKPRCVPLSAHHAAAVLTGLCLT